MKIDKKRIKKFAGVTPLVAAVAIGGTIAINEYTVNHNENICLLTRILGWDHQVQAINKDEENIKNGVFAEYSEIYYEVPDGYIIHRKDMTGYKKVDGYTAYDSNNNNQPYQVSATMLTMNPTIYFVPNIEIFKHNDELNEDELVKELKLK